MKTLLVLPAIARLSDGDDTTAPASTERVPGAWVGFLLSVVQDADRSWESEDERSVDTSAAVDALHHLKVGDIVFTGRSTTDTVGIVLDRDAHVLGDARTFKSPDRDANAKKASAISRTLEFLRK